MNLRLKCKYKLFDFVAEYFILFDLEKIANYFQSYKLSLELCFEYYDRGQFNSSFCWNECDYHKAIAYRKIFRPPPVLVLILERGHGKIFKGEVKINKNIDLKDFIDEENYKYCSKYELICVSTHEGESSSSDHYTARCLTNYNRYYCFSNTYVIEIDEEHLIGNEPYFPFYKQIENFFL